MSQLPNVDVELLAVITGFAEYAYKNNLFDTGNKKKNKEIKRKLKMEIKRAKHDLRRSSPWTIWNMP